MKLNLGDEITRQEMCLFARPCEHQESGFELIPVHPNFKWVMNDSDINIDTINIEYLPPANMSKNDIVKKAILTLRDKQKQIRADSHKRVQELEEKISQMLMITDQSEDNDQDLVIDLVSNEDDEIPF